MKLCRHRFRWVRVRTDLNASLSCSKGWAVDWLQSFLETFLSKAVRGAEDLDELLG